MRRKICTGEGAFHYVTFSTRGRRKLLSNPQARQIVISVLGKLSYRGEVKVSGFVVMPDHVHAVLWFDNDADLPRIMRVWKSTSAHYLRKYYEENVPGMLDKLKTERNGRIVYCFWQRKYYDFNIFKPEKLGEKLNYMHANPVKKGLAEKTHYYLWSSALWYDQRKSVGVKITPGF